MTKMVTEKMIKDSSRYNLKFSQNYYFLHTMSNNMSLNKSDIQIVTGFESTVWNACSVEFISMNIGKQ